MQPPPNRTVLMVAYEFPPSAGGGVQRLARLARYLPESGWTPEVISGEPIEGRPRDDALLGLVGDVSVTRVPSRNIIVSLSRLGSPVRSLVRRPRAARIAAPPATSASDAGEPKTPRSPLSTRMARWVAVPDEAVLWGRDVVRAARALAKRQLFDAVLASGPPFSALVAGVRIADEAGVPVVLDMRDAWRDSLSVAWPTRMHRARSEEIERWALAAAAGVTAASPGIAKEATEMGARRVELVLNGFDAADMPPHRPDAGGPMKITFLGRFSKDVTDPTTFLRGLALARERDDALKAVRFDVIGPSAPWVGRMVVDLVLDEAVSYHGFKPYAEALEMVSHSDVGLLCISDRPGAEEVLTGKLFDYLGIGVSVLLVGPVDGGAASLIREARAGRVTPADSVQGVAEAIAELARLKSEGLPLAEPDRDVVSRFDRRTQVAGVAALLDEVTEGNRR